MLEQKSRICAENIGQQCDEVAPRCNNCTKHEIECEFSIDPSQRSTVVPRASRKRVSVSNRSDHKSEKGHSSTKSPLFQHADSDESSYDLPALQMEDLELLHHFTTETCYTLSDRAESHHLWQLVVPQEAFKHDFLMRGILAISALHLSVQGGKKQEHWAKVAAHQQDAALTTFRPLMTNMNDSNCDAFFALSSLIVVYGFEFPRSKDSLGLFDCKGDQSDEWLPLIRGVNSIIQSQWPCIKRGKLSSLLHDHPRVPPQVQIPAALEEQLQRLEKLCMTPVGGQDTIYNEAVDALRDCFVRMNNKQLYECEVSIAFLWPVMVPQEFINRVNARASHALIILAHYCVILYYLNNYWWLNGWATHIIENIFRQLEDDKRFWLHWPANVVGLDLDLSRKGRLDTRPASTEVHKDLQISTIDEKEPLSLEGSAIAQENAS